MAILFLAGYVLFFNTAVIFQKKYRTDTAHIKSSAYLFMMLTGVLGTVYYFIMSGGSVSLDKTTFGYSLVYAFVCASSIFVSMLSFDLIDLVYRVLCAGAGGMIVPFVFEIVTGMEQFSWVRFAAVFIRVVAIILPLFFIERTKKIGKTAFFVCAFMFLEAGASTIIPKLYGQTAAPLSNAVFCFWANVFMIPLIVMFSVLRIGVKNISSDIRCIKPKSYGYLLLNATIGNCGTLFSLASLRLLSATFYTIVSSTLSLAFTAAVSVLVFREKQTVASYISIVLSVIAIVLYVI